MTWLSSLADDAYLKLRRDGGIFVPLEVRESEKVFDAFLSLLRYRARKDGYRVYTYRGTRKQPLAMYDRVFELHHAIDNSKPLGKQPRGIARPDAPPEPPCAD